MSILKHLNMSNNITEEEAKRAAMEWAAKLPDYNGRPQHKAITDKPDLFPKLTDEQLRECALKWAGMQPDKRVKNG